MANKMLIDTTHPEETRVVVVRGNRVEEFDFESANRRQLRGNIYLAKVTRVEPSLQAAFVEYGGNRHGFLAFSEIHPDYYQIPVADRQALIDEEERAHRAAEDEADRRERRGGGRRRRSAAAHRPRGEPLTSEPIGRDKDSAAEPANAPDAGGEPTGDVSAAAPIADAEFTQAERQAKTADEDMAAGPVAHPEDRPEAARSPEHQPEEHHDVALAPANEHRPLGEEDAAAPRETPQAALGVAPEPDHRADSNGSDPDEGADDEEDAVESVGGADALEEVQERMPRFRRQYKIQEVIKRRQVMLVQVVKEERGTKGAALTTYLSLAGRYSVLMPNTARGGGISRKITSAEDRKRLKQVAEDLEVPEGMGVILRTAGANRTKAEVKRDFEYLLRLWETVRDLTLQSTAPKLVYEEGSLIKRSIRDLYNKDIDEIVVAGDEGYREAKDFMRMLMPSHAKNVKPYKDTQPLFTRSGIESQLDAMFSPVVQLRSGGYIVINQAEALVAIDVNSGRATREHHIEDTALKTNSEAAEEIARQLRLRDLAGLIVIDFIDMDEKRNNRAVERRVKECLKHDRARIQVGRISHFGLLEMSRQRIRTSVLESSTEKCPHCGGTGHVRSVSSVTLQLLRSLEEMMLKGATHNMVVRTRTDVALYVLNNKRAHLRELETRFRIAVAVNADATINGQQPYVIERGEQVHSIEAARAIAVQPDSVMPELAAEDEEEDEAALGAAELTESPAEDDRGEGERVESEGDRGEDGARRRRRRRRRRRPGEQPDPAEPAPSADFAPGAEDAEHLGEDEAEEGGEERTRSEAGGENGEAERRRRRRGRRGGRRSGRREREGEARPDSAAGAEVAAGWQEWAQARQVDAVDPPAAPENQGAPPEPAEQVAPAAAVMPAPEPELAESAAPKRRSTVREPAPFVIGGSDAQPQATAAAAEPAGAPEPAHVPTSIEEETPVQTDRPRRTGWWAKRVLGKG